MISLASRKSINMDARPARNPELEKLRNEVLDSEQEYVRNAKELASQLTAIHAAYLFCDCGRLASSKICTVISATPVNTAATGSWKDLASLLGLSFHQICCIENYRSSDFTENVLKAFAQKMYSTLDQIVLALCELKRYDAISVAQPHLLMLEKQARREQVVRTELEDSKFYSIDGLETEKPTYDGILRPAGIRHLRSQLHITLRNLDMPMYDETESEIQEKVEENLLQSTVLKQAELRNKNRCSKRVMLTFAEDGEKTAYQVAAELRKQRGVYLPIGVLILEEHYDKVEANAEQFILHYFPKLDYIIPIITPKYLDSIGKNSSSQESILSAIDTRYVQMIHTLMTKYYVGNSCRNDKFRSIIPDNFCNLLNDVRMKKDLVLQAFVIESKLELLALRILKNKKS